LFTREGVDLIDFTAGIAVMNVGHAHPDVTRAVQEAASQGTHFCFQVMGYDGYVRLAERLQGLMPKQAGADEGDHSHAQLSWKSAFFNSGAEAVDNAIKIARVSTGRQTVLSFEHAFHGRTYAALSLTSKPLPYRLGLGPFLPETVQVPYPTQYRCAGCPGTVMGCDCKEVTLDRIRQIFATRIPPDEVAAVFVEPIVGEGGFYMPATGFMKELRKLCSAHGILLVIDEIQTGVARTGTFFRFESEGIVPDLLLTAKALGGGLPLSAVVGRAEIIDRVHPGGLGGTYGGNPVAVAAAHAVLDIVEREDLCAVARRKGALAMKAMRAWQARYPQRIGDVRGSGLMLAAEFVLDPVSRRPDKDTPNRLVDLCYDRGLVILPAGTYGNCIRLLPPITIPDEQLDAGLAILGEAIDEVLNKPSKTA
jgi:4-aminobutyrate aminotransferase